jgi:hypothetical protein
MLKNKTISLEPVNLMHEGKRSFGGVMINLPHR